MSSDKAKHALNIDELRSMAQKRLPRWLFEMIDRGVEDEVALRNNRDAFERIKLLPRALVDVSDREQSVSIFGQRHAMPLGISPTGSASMVRYLGELELARAAREAQIPYTMGTSSLTSMEDVAGLVGGTLWFQLYLWADVAVSHGLVRRAKESGFEALVLTVDSPVGGNREYNIRNGAESPFHLNRRNAASVLTSPAWIADVLLRYSLHGGMPVRANYPDDMPEKFSRLRTLERRTKNDSVTWDDFSELREMWPRTLLVKGILTPYDAELAVSLGADGIVVSNHGGRVFDSTMAPIEALWDIVDAVGSRTTVIVDSGFRRGSDVVKALAIGADMVMVGRPTLYGTAVAGQAGAARALEIFRDEISRTMAYLGCRTIDQLGREFVRFS